MKIQASAPSNIALIKYMGKGDAEANRPLNTSFSYTLEGLRTFVEILPIDAEKDRWEALDDSQLEKFVMNEKGVERFLNHFQFLKKQFGIQGNYLIKSANNFPSDCGLASSASSFAALTRATAELARQQNLDPGGAFDLAELSRRGSGSSCRSFFGPWVLWEPDRVRPLEFKMLPLRHSVIVVESKKKTVSSKEAHRRVMTSPLFVSRPERAEQRLAKLIASFKSGDWQESFEIVWAEFWDMHALFETSSPAFGYFEPGTMQVLIGLRDLWNEKKDGPLVTMDAGANIHLLFRHDQAELQTQLGQQWGSQFGVYSREATLTL